MRPQVKLNNNRNYLKQSLKINCGAVDTGMQCSSGFQRHRRLHLIAASFELFMKLLHVRPIFICQTEPFLHLQQT